MGQKRNLRQFRKQVARLKKQGLIPKTTDARRAQPFWLRGGHRLDELVRKFSNVASGNATVVQLTSEETKKFKAQGYKTIGRGKAARVVVPHGPEERVFVSHGYVTIKHPAGISRIQIPIAYHDLEQYLTDIQKQKRRINRLKNTDEYFGFRFFGHRSSMYSRDIGLLIGELIKYDSIQAAIKDDSARDMDQLYQNLEIIRFDRPETWFENVEASSRMQHARHRSFKAKYRQRKLQLKRGPEWKKEQYRSQNAERQRQYRERLKNDPDAYADYLAAGKKRKQEWKNRNRSK